MCYIHTERSLRRSFAQNVAQKIFRNGILRLGNAPNVGRHEENGYCFDGGLRSGIKSIERRDIRKKQTIQLLEEMRLTDPADTEQLFCL